jgi:hypothetical protein
MDLFNSDTVRSTDFAEFWALVPQGAKTGKREADKAWRKLRKDERDAAKNSAAKYYEWWRKANPQASWLHPSTYLNQRRWEDEAWQPAQEGPAVDRAAFWADCINQGKFVSTATCPPQMCKEMLDRKLVTQEQLRQRGLY